MHHQRKLRIAAVQTLFQLDAQGDDFAEEITNFLHEQGLADRDAERTRELVDVVSTHQAEIDERIIGVSKHWNLSRITPIDRAILRLGVCEMLFVEHTPPKVAINEAIELAKTFGEAESPHFVNGMLDAIWKKYQHSNR